MEERTSWAVRTVDLRVAIQAAAVDSKSRHRIARIGRMEICCIMAALTQPRPRDHQQVLVDRAVRIMAVQAALHDRWMLKQIRTALLGMALEADLVDGGFLQQMFAVAPMRTVAVGAHHFAFRQRHVLRARELCSNVFMALEAGVGLRRRFQLVLARYRLHDCVAVRAHQVPRLVNAAAPQRAGALFVAAETDGVVFLRGAAVILRPE